MEYGRLGTTGVKVSRICLGMMTYGKKSWRPWILEEDEARPLIRAAIDASITFFDTADVYLGASSMYSWQFLKMLEFQKQNGFARFVTMQNHYNLIYREWSARSFVPLDELV